MPKLLLHICCGPCAEWPVEQLRQEGFAVDAYYYNPNIHPRGEWQRRLENAQKMAEFHQVTLYWNEDYREADWRAFPTKKKSDHCRYCYALRLEAGAAFAQAHGYTHFSSSLLVSPYQEQVLLRQLGAQACRRHGLIFVDRPFTEGYREGQEMAKADGLYRQKYCGCLYSLGETRARYRRKVLREFGLSEAFVLERDSEQSTASEEVPRQ